jgi:hypothetical protein
MGRESGYEEAVTLAREFNGGAELIDETAVGRKT